MIMIDQCVYLYYLTVVAKVSQFITALYCLFAKIHMNYKLQHNIIIYILHCTLTNTIIKAYIEFHSCITVTVVPFVVARWKMDCIWVKMFHLVVAMCTLLNHAFIVMWSRELALNTSQHCTLKDVLEP